MSVFDFIPYKGVIMLALGLALVLYLMGGFLRNHFLRKMTAMCDLEMLGVPREPEAKLKGTVVICGGSVAGLHAARVCVDHFESVCIVEPEAWLASVDGQVDRTREHYVEPGVKPNIRTRVAQYTSIHIYQLFALLAWRRWFPGIDQALQAAEGRIGPADIQLHWDGNLIPAPWHMCPADKFPVNMSMSRPFFETLLRRIVLRTYSNIEWVTGTAIGLHPGAGDPRAIESVSIRMPSGEIVKKPTALVIDCTGSTQAGFKMLGSAGYGGESLAGIKEQYQPYMRYTTAEFKISDRALNSVIPPGLQDRLIWWFLANNPAKEHRTMGFLRVEKDYLQVQTGGWNYQSKVRSVEDIRAHARSLNTLNPVPYYVLDLLDLLQDKAERTATWTDSGVTAPLNTIFYEKATSMPSNFVAIGDSTMRLNPVNGQGCTKAIIGAVTLDGLLRSIPPSSSRTLPTGFGSKFFSVLSERLNPVWTSVKYQDYAFGSTKTAEGETTAKGRFTRSFTGHLLNLATEDRDVAAVFWEVREFLAPPTDFFSPTVLGKLVWRELRLRMSDR